MESEVTQSGEENKSLSRGCMRDLGDADLTFVGDSAQCSPRRKSRARTYMTHRGAVLHELYFRALQDVWL